MAKTSKIITNDLLQRFWDGFKENLHIHSNKSVLDGMTASYTSADKAKLNDITYLTNEEIDTLLTEE